MGEPTRSRGWRRPALWVYLLSLPLVFQVVYVLSERGGPSPAGGGQWVTVVVVVLAGWTAVFWLCLFLATRVARGLEGFVADLLKSGR